MSTRRPTPLTYVDYFTTTHRISGGIQTGVAPLSDQLNDRSQSYMMVSNVYISRLDTPGDIGAHASVAYLSKENLTFVIAPAREVRISEAGRSTAQEYQALVSVPGFEVRGRFYGPGRIHLRNFSPATLEAFVILLDATAQSTTLPDTVFSGEVILINRARLESLCLGE